MRIIAGTHGGRKLMVPKNKDIRPTSDKIRGSIFNALEARISLEDAHVMDICCGTGALGLEAISRGAIHCTFIDNAQSSLKLAKDNAENFALERHCMFMRTSCTSLKTRPEEQEKIHIFFCDPPYNQNLIEGALQALIKGDWLHEDALGILESEKSWSFSSHDHFELLSEKTYGDTKITYITPL